MVTGNYGYAFVLLTVDSIRYQQPQSVFATMPCLYTFHEPPVVTSASNAHPVGVPVEVSTHIYFGGDEYVVMVAYCYYCTLWT